MRERLELALERVRRRRAPARPARARQPGAGRAHGLRPDAARHRATTGRSIAERMALVPQGLSSIEAALAEGVQQGIVAARRQAVGVRASRPTRGAASTPRHPPFFLDAGRRVRRVGHRRPRAARPARELATRATEAYAALGRYLVEEYAPHADRARPGRTRALRAVRAAYFNGIELDLDETYAWGWDELHRIEHAMGQVAERILPGADVDEVIEHLETDPTARDRGRRRRSGAGTRTSSTRTVAELDGTHFDIPEPVQRVEAMIAPPGGAAAMYYTGPSEDFSRPGRTWYPTLGKTRFPLWGEVSICYHEGVPGHHLQIAAGALPRRHAEPLPAHARGHVGPRRGLGALRRAAHGRARLPRRPRVRARHAARAGDARGARRRRHRHAPRAADPGATSATTRARRGRPSSRCRS